VSDVERRIQAAIRADATRSREVERIGPFVATFTPGSRNPYLNYAIPEADGEPTDGDVAALVEAFAGRGYAPRLEYVPGVAPAVEPALLEARFVVEGRLPLMVCERRPDSVVPAAIDVRVAVTRDDVRAAAIAQNEAYGEPDPPSESWVDGSLRSIAAGGLLVVATEAVTGEPAGGGACTPPHEGATELTSIGVRPAHRRRGIAGAMVALLAQTMLDRGVDLVFLMAAGEAEARIYARVGFTRIGEVLHISVPVSAPANIAPAPFSHGSANVS
jgi:ribosomal protein S18 acetylase RimI-like enzyme